LSYTVEIRNELEITVEKVVRAIGKQLDDKGNSITKFNPEEIKRKQRPSLSYLIG
jgi:hypothetical protein